MKQSLTQEELKKVLQYDPETGIFRWRYSVAKWLPQWSEAGSKTANGYTIIKIQQHRHFAHRLAWLYMTGEWPIEQIDHINREPSDNRFVNLREATPTQNMGNRNIQCNNTSGFQGVHYRTSTNKWIAQTRHNKKKIHIGCFNTPEEASKAYNEYVTKLRGEYATTFG